MTYNSKILSREFLVGFWKIHILHHASEGPVVGQWMIRELREHGYDVSPGTLYPLLKRMESNKWLVCKTQGKGPRARREYTITKEGKEVLAVVKRFLSELSGEAGRPEKKKIKKSK